MTTFAGLPAHILLVHLIVVLAPLTALLAILAAFLPAVRRRLVWLILAFAAITLIATPITTDAGEWLEERVDETGALETHTELGDTMIYFAAALAVVAIALVVVHLRERTHPVTSKPVVVAVAVLALVVGVGTMVQVYRIGDSGARATWGDTSLSEQGGESE